MTGGNALYAPPTLPVTCNAIFAAANKRRGRRSIPSSLRDEGAAPTAAL